MPSTGSSSLGLLTLPWGRKVSGHGDRAPCAATVLYCVLPAAVETTATPALMSVTSLRI